MNKKWLIKIDYEDNSPSSYILLKHYMDDFSLCLSNSEGNPIDKVIADKYFYWRGKNILKVKHTITQV